MKIFFLFSLAILASNIMMQNAYASRTVQSAAATASPTGTKETQLLKQLFKFEIRYTDAKSQLDKLGPNSFESRTINHLLSIVTKNDLPRAAATNICVRIGLMTHLESEKKFRQKLAMLYTNKKNLSHKYKNLEPKFARAVALKMTQHPGRSFEDAIEMVAKDRLKKLPEIRTRVCQYITDDSLSFANAQRRARAEYWAQRLQTIFPNLTPNIRQQIFKAIAAPQNLTNDLPNLELLNQASQGQILEMIIQKDQPAGIQIIHYCLEQKKGFHHALQTYLHQDKKLEVEFAQAVAQRLIEDQDWNVPEAVKSEIETTLETAPHLHKRVEQYLTNDSRSFASAQQSAREDYWEAQLKEQLPSVSSENRPALVKALVSSPLEQEQAALQLLIQASREPALKAIIKDDEKAGIRVIQDFVTQTRGLLETLQTYLQQDKKLEMEFAKAVSPRVRYLGDISKAIRLEIEERLAGEKHLYEKTRSYILYGSVAFEEARQQAKVEYCRTELRQYAPPGFYTPNLREVLDRTFKENPPLIITIFDKIEDFKKRYNRLGTEFSSDVARQMLLNPEYGCEEAIRAAISDVQPSDLRDKIYRNIVGNSRSYAHAVRLARASYWDEQLQAFFPDFTPENRQALCKELINIRSLSEEKKSLEFLPQLSTEESLKNIIKNDKPAAIQIIKYCLTQEQDLLKAVQRYLNQDKKLEAEFAQAVAVRITSAKDLDIKQAILQEIEERLEGAPHLHKKVYELIVGGFSSFKGVQEAARNEYWGEKLKNCFRLDWIPYELIDTLLPHLSKDQEIIKALEDDPEQPEKALCTYMMQHTEIFEKTFVDFEDTSRLPKQKFYQWLTQSLLKGGSYPYKTKVLQFKFPPQLTNRFQVRVLECLLNTPIAELEDQQGFSQQSSWDTIFPKECPLDMLLSCIQVFCPKSGEFLTKIDNKDEDLTDEQVQKFVEKSFALFLLSVKKYEAPELLPYLRLLNDPNKGYRQFYQHVARHYFKGNFDAFKARTEVLEKLQSLQQDLRTRYPYLEEDATALAAWTQVIEGDDSTERFIYQAIKAHHKLPGADLSHIVDPSDLKEYQKKLAHFIKDKPGLNLADAEQTYIEFLETRKQTLLPNSLELSAETANQILWQVEILDQQLPTAIGEVIRKSDPTVLNDLIDAWLPTMEKRKQERTVTYQVGGVMVSQSVSVHKAVRHVRIEKTYLQFQKTQKILLPAATLKEIATACIDKGQSFEEVFVEQYDRLGLNLQIPDDHVQVFAEALTQGTHPIVAHYDCLVATKDDDDSVLALAAQVMSNLGLKIEQIPEGQEVPADFEASYQCLHEANPDTLPLDVNQVYVLFALLSRKLCAADLECDKFEPHMQDFRVLAKVLREEEIDASTLLQMPTEELVKSARICWDLLPKQVEEEIGFIQKAIVNGRKEAQDRTISYEEECTKLPLSKWDPRQIRYANLIRDCLSKKQTGDIIVNTQQVQFDPFVDLSNQEAILSVVVEDEEYKAMRDELTKFVRNYRGYDTLKKNYAFRGICRFFAWGGLDIDLYLSVDIDRPKALENDHARWRARIKNLYSGLLDPAKHHESPDDLAGLLDTIIVQGQTCIDSSRQALDTLEQHPKVGFKTHCPDLKERLSEILRVWRMQKLSQLAATRCATRQNFSVQTEYPVFMKIAAKHGLSIHGFEVSQSYHGAVKYSDTHFTEDITTFWTDYQQNICQVVLDAFEAKDMPSGDRNGQKFYLAQVQEWAQTTPWYCNALDLEEELILKDPKTPEVITLRPTVARRLLQWHGYIDEGL